MTAKRDADEVNTGLAGIPVSSSNNYFTLFSGFPKPITGKEYGQRRNRNI